MPTTTEETTIPHLAPPYTTAEATPGFGVSSVYSFKELAKFALCAAYKFSGAMFVQERLLWASGRQTLTIALFHRVSDEIQPDGLTVSTQWFRGFCRLMKKKFHVITLDQVMKHLRDGVPIPRRTVAITFDDCYRDNLDAARVLNEFGLPATFFIPTQFVSTDHQFFWDQHLKRRLANLTWDEVHEMVRLGHEIGAHSVSHADFGCIDAEQARRELTDSKRELEERFQRPIRWFAYPFGGRDNFKKEYLPLVLEAGYEACFSGYGGVAYPAMYGHVIRREPMPSFNTLLNLELHLSGCLDWLYRVKRKTGFVFS